MKRIASTLAFLLVAVASFNLTAGPADAVVEPTADALWDLSVTPSVPNWPDSNSVEVGVQFVTSEDIEIIGVRFYKGTQNTGQHTGSLWDDAGNLLATGVFENETSEGWQDLLFDTPVSMTSADTYVASYFVPVGYYSAENSYFETALTSGPVTAIASADSCGTPNCSIDGGNGLYRYGDSSSFPVFTYLSSNYWVSPLWTRSPIITSAASDVAGDEGSLLTVSGSFSDPDGQALTLTADNAVGTFSSDGDGNWQWSYSPTDDDSGTITVTASDGYTSTTDSFDFTVNNVAPSVGAINGAPSGPIAVGQLVELTAAFTDPGLSDTHVDAWTWGDGSTEGSGPTTSPASASHTYSSPGIYDVSVTVTDDDGGFGTSTLAQSIVVYDPSAGFVTGGGTFDSPAGAYQADPLLTGSANFGFVSKYKKGASQPDGNTQFQFKAAGLKFHSTSYEWLVVTGGDSAKFKGEGTINGSGEYKFQLWAEDGKSSGGADTIRIKIWTEDPFGVETVIYDNGTDQAISKGSIVVHAK